MKYWIYGDLLYVRKESGVASDFGKTHNLLDELSHLDIPGYSLLGSECEFGLMNRLDTPTQGVVYVALSQLFYEDFIKKQKQQQIFKFYLCHTHGDIFQTRDSYNAKHKITGNNYASFSILDGESMLGKSMREVYDKLPQDVIAYCLSRINTNKLDSVLPCENGFFVSFPIMHHKHDDSRMIALVHPNMINKGRGDQLQSSTYVYPLLYDGKENTSWSLAIITQGRRHQIRLHLSHMGAPIVGDHLYGTKDSRSELGLYSIGCVIKE